MPSLDCNLNQTIIIAAIINGLIFCVLLLRKSENRQANCFLSLLVFSICYSLIGQLMVDLHIYDWYPALHWLPGGMAYLIGPTFYFYVKSLTQPDFRLRKRHAWHFGWIICDYFHSTYHLVYGRSIPYPKLHNFTEAMDVYVIFPLLIYVYFGARLIRRYRRELMDQLSATESQTLSWLRQLLWVGGVVIFPIVVILLVDHRIFYDFDMEFFEGILLRYDLIINFFLVLLIYWLSIGGFRQSQIQLMPKLMADNSDQMVADHTKSLHILIKAMREQQLFLDPVLSLNKLSRHTGLPEREISAAINQVLEKNF